MGLDLDLFLQVQLAQGYVGAGIMAAYAYLQFYLHCTNF